MVDHFGGIAVVGLQTGGITDKDQKRRISRFGGKFVWVVLENVPAKPANQGERRTAEDPLLHVICRLLEVGGFGVGGAASGGAVSQPATTLAL